MIRDGLSEHEATRRFWCVDKQGLLVDDMGDLRDYQQPYARPRAELAGWTRDDRDGSISLAEVVARAKPTIIVGTSTVGGAFTEPILRQMAKEVERPMVFPLSNPTERIEAVPADVIRWTEGRGLVATGTPWGPVPFKGTDYAVGQANNALVYPGIGLGAIVSGARRVTDGMLLAAAEAIAGLVDVSRPGAGLLPEVENLRITSATVAVAVAKQAAAEGVARNDLSDPVEAVQEAAAHLREPRGVVMAATAMKIAAPVPIGTGASTGTRVESDSMGQIDVPAEHYWGAQTQRSLIHFSIGDDHMPKAVYHAYGYVKKAAAIVNAAAGRLDRERSDAIVTAADEVIAGKLDSEFPLYVWQTGSGTQSNMNVNEVIANRASQLLGGELGTKTPVHPNDHVNLGQSSNDTFPTAMHLATLLEINGHTLPHVDQLADAVWAKAVEWVDVVKIGRTHLQDATPLTVGQEWSGWAVQLRDARDRLAVALDGCHELAAGGTAVGTGINAPDGFGEQIAEKLAGLTGLPLKTAPNKFAAQGSLDAMVAVSGGLRGVAVALMKIANDLRWLASGPRAGLHELKLPANEPGSSIMPGKVNPTQQEAMVMVCLQVLGEDSIVAAAGAQGNFELNAMRPIIINNVLHSARILGDASEKLRVYSIEGAELDLDRVQQYVGRSLMLVTALSPTIGYDKASAIAHKADDEGITLREAALSSGVPASEFDQIVKPETMVGNPTPRPRTQATRQDPDMIATHALPAGQVPGRRRTRAAVVHSATLAISCLASYWLVTHVLAHVHSLSRADNLLGGTWAVVATAFVYRTSHQQSVSAALSRTAATSLSFVLCLIYLLLLPFHPWGLAALIGIGTLVLMLTGHSDDTVTTAITTAVVMVVAALTPHDAWEQPILRIVDTAVGIAVGLAASWTALHLTAGECAVHTPDRSSALRLLVASRGDARPPQVGGA